jgi:hypothetical protein
VSAKKIRYYKIPYIIQRGDTYAKILKRFVKADSVILNSTPMVRKTQRENRFIRNWRKLPSGKKINLYISTDFIDLNKYRRYRKEIRKKILAAKKKLKEKSKGVKKKKSSPFPTGLKGSMFYMASYGQFTQSDPEVAELTFLQNSPVSLGGAFTYYPPEKNYSIAWSLYFSYLLAAGNNLDASNVSIPPEIGGNIYGEYRFVKQRFTGYFGLDFERFSTFNLGGIQNDRRIYVDESRVFYLTGGISKLISIFGSKFFTKLSASVSISETTTNDPRGVPTTEPYSGAKILWYLNKKISKSFFLHTLFKYHFMSGPSDLTTLRLGVGFGYILF